MACGAAHQPRIPRLVLPDASSRTRRLAGRADRAYLRGRRGPRFEHRRSVHRPLCAASWAPSVIETVRGLGYRIAGGSRCDRIIARPGLARAPFSGRSDSSRSSPSSSRSACTCGHPRSSFIPTGCQRRPGAPVHDRRHRPDAPRPGAIRRHAPPPGGCPQGDRAAAARLVSDGGPAARRRPQRPARSSRSNRYAGRSPRPAISRTA